MSNNNTLLAQYEQANKQGSLNDRTNSTITDEELDDLVMEFLTKRGSATHRSPRRNKRKRPEN